MDHRFNLSKSASKRGALLTSLLLAIAFLSSVHAQKGLAKGTVYLDANANGLYDVGEHGIANVKVSNGVNVVKTNAQGQYKIVLPPESILFISKPTNYRLPLNEVQLPQFYYRHYPNGTPDLAAWKWPVIQPTGTLPKTIDFALLEGAVPDAFKAMGFADPQTTTNEELDMMRKDIIDALFGNPYEAEFGLVAGDVVNDNLALYERHNGLMAQIGIPMWNVPGNHDLNPESPNYTYATQTFKSVFGPDYYSFDYGQVHFLALNNVGFKGKGQGYEGHIDANQMQWIANDLKDVPSNKLIMIITHIPLLTYANNRTFPKGINTQNLDELLNVLKRFEYVYAIAGHDTSNSWKVEINHAHGWHGRPFIAHTLAETRGGGWHTGPRDERGVRPATMQDGNPNGYYIFYFDGNKVKPRFIPAGGNPKDRLRITLDPQLGPPKSLEQAHALGLDRGVQADSTFVVVNFFDGGERDQVTISLNGKTAVPMQYTERTDPFYVQQYQKYKGTSDAFASPAISSHIWQYPLSNLEPGVHSAIVIATDEFGFKDQETLTFEILKGE
jgi:calcineurin-like phosphoesterase family protein